MEKQTKNVKITLTTKEFEDEKFCTGCPTVDGKREFCKGCANEQINKLNGFLRETSEKFEIAPGEWQKKSERTKEIEAREKRQVEYQKEDWEDDDETD